MNIVLLGHEDIASIRALNTLASLRPEHRYTVFWSGAMPESAEPAPRLHALAARDRELFDEYLENLDPGSAFHRAESLSAPNKEDGLAILRGLTPDLLVSIRYRRILRDEAIAIPTHGVLNLHSGILPAYQGVMATFWAMLNGEREIGSTLHRIVDAGIDTGPVIAAAHQPVDYSASYLENVLGLYDDGCALIAAAIDEIASTGDVSAVPQTPGAGTYYTAPREADAALFEGRGLHLAPAVGWMPGL